MTPAPLRPTAAQLGLVVLGGAIGTAARAGLLLIDAPGWSVVAVPAINVVGAFLLGVLTGVLARRPASPRARAARQLIGTGVLGGFTTYSTFAVQAVDGAAVLTTVVTVLLGVAAAAGGLALGGRRRAA